MKNFLKKVGSAVAVKSAREVVFWGGAWLVTFAGTFGLNKGFLFLHKWKFLGCFGGFAGVVMVASVIVRSARLLYRWRVSVWTGISRVYPVSAYGDQSGTPLYDERREAEKAIAESVKASPKVQLLLASGWRYVGGGNHPGVLWNSITDLKRKVKFETLEILLLDPESDYAKNYTDLQPGQYAEGIRAILYSIKEWMARRTDVPIEVRLYSEPPIWQLVITKQELWLLCAHKIPSALSPIYCMDRAAAEKYGLAHGLFAVWRRRWETANKVDWTKVERPDWSKVFNKHGAGSTPAAVPVVDAAQ